MDQDTAQQPGGQALLSLDRLRAGDRAEIARLVDSHSGAVYRVAFKILNDAQDAEDVLQETFIKAIKRLPAFEGRSSLSTWLYRIAVNEALMLLRKRRAQPGTVEIDAEDEVSEREPVQIVDWCCLPEGDYLSAEARRFLDDAIQRLTPALRAVFVLRDIEGLPVRETAEALGVTEGTVKTRLLRARMKLREALTGYFGDRVKRGRNDG